MTNEWVKIGHRGTPREFPANTMRSFQRAAELGCGMVECDIRRSADGILVLAHDPEVTDTTGRTFIVTETSAADLHALDLGAGEGVPTLAELVAWAQGHCAIMADMKCEGGNIEPSVVEELAPLPPTAKVVPGAGEASRRRFRALDPTLPLSLSLDRLAPLLPDSADFERFVAQIDTDAVTWKHPLLNVERIAVLHTRGLRVYAWTVDDLPTMRRLLAAGVDGLISNRADLLQTL